MRPARPWRTRQTLRRGLALSVAWAMWLAGLSAAQAAPAAVQDDTGAWVRLAAPAQRIVSLSPGITELLFTIGAGERIVGASEYSDYPAAARTLPRVSRAQGIDLERIAALRPDLIVTWGSGYSPALLESLRRLGVAVYVLETRTLESIATSMERLGQLCGSAGAAASAAAFRRGLADLREQYAGRSPVRAFYQVWANPVMTLSGGHVASEILRVCGARNVFEDLQPLVATVDIEAVVASRPQIIVTAEPGAQDHGALDGWRRFAQIPAVARGNLVTLDADTLDRGSARVLDAARELCAAVQRVRAAQWAPAP